MTFDYIKAKFFKKKYICYNCKKYISNIEFNILDKCSNMDSEGGGWCKPFKNKSFYIAINSNDDICKKFKFRGNNKL